MKKWTIIWKIVATNMISTHNRIMKWMNNTQMNRVNQAQFNLIISKMTIIISNRKCNKYILINIKIMAHTVKMKIHLNQLYSKKMYSIRIKMRWMGMVMSFISTYKIIIKKNRSISIKKNQFKARTEIFKIKCLI